MFFEGRRNTKGTFTVTLAGATNPFYSFTSIKAQTSSKLTVVISDAVSRKLSQTSFSNSTQVSASLLAKRAYLVTLHDANGQLFTTKKMLKN